eukprot:XP_014785023.1 PREDICTED: uncharacterized protein LOC106879833 [Octopus bimaculoides]
MRPIVASLSCETHRLKNDIAILTLANSIKADSCVQFAPLAQKGETFDGARCIAAGWGDLGWDFFGDSGGPLYCLSKITGKMVLVGVTSFGNKCDKEISAFSSVAYFRDWIANNI